MAIQCTVPATQAPAPAAPATEAPAPAAAQKFKLAAILPGVITDADYNTLGYIGVTTVQTDLGIEVAYSESVPVPDVERVMREYIDDGFNIIFTHGGQFVSQTQALAKEFPEVYFIAEGDAPVEDAPPNFWIIDSHAKYQVWRSLQGLLGGRLMGVSASFLRNGGSTWRHMRQLKPLACRFCPPGPPILGGVSRRSAGSPQDWGVRGADRRADSKSQSLS